MGKYLEGVYYPAKPGDHIVVKCWMKTDSSTPTENANPYHGARINLVFFGPNGVGGFAILNGYPHDGQEHLDSTVRWGTSVWTLRTWDVIVPSTIYTTDVNGVVIPATPITLMTLSLYVTGDLAVGNAWFADTELYINPSVPPTTYPLSYSSTPISVPLSYDSQQLASGQSVQLPAETIIISVPSEVTT